ncbi:GNAT family N-acetyltransferase [Natrononativus amylolyticus]|uniref:GNAT family N-acetyltransferase n=1 Tax=Natrononativus amylolyticus TaxID=2963434 RepID=UPI0020CC4AC7|nr:GNAT family N-acetyltransferase [Natrononativus amylolyticus]
MLDCRRLTADDLADALELSRQAGWNQVAADWQRLLALSPEGCFAGTVDGQLVATTTVITYGDDVSWIGMVLVDEAHRSQGYGSRIFERGLEYARERGGRRLGLDATHLGEPIYEKYGFERVAPVFRWQGTLSDNDGEHRAESAEPLESELLDAVCAFDRNALAVDRTDLVRELVAEPDVRGFVVGDSASVDGYAFVRPGRTHRQIGPIVASDSRTLEALLAAVTTALGERAVIVDAPERAGVEAALEAAGLDRTRELVRMTHPDRAELLLSDSVCGLVDFAFG